VPAAGLPVAFGCRLRARPESVLKLSTGEKNLTTKVRHIDHDGLAPPLSAPADSLSLLIHRHRGTDDLMPALTRPIQRAALPGVALLCNPRIGLASR
jgi:hypothetical protein